MDPHDHTGRETGGDTGGTAGGGRRRCYLHVGCPKTGTTYLQSVLWRSRDELAAQGVRLPLRHVHDHFFLTLALRDRLDPVNDSPYALDVLDRFAAAVAAPGDGDLLVSHELLAPVAPNRVADLMALLEGFEVHVVITARDLRRQIPAEWQQHLKTRSEKTYAEFVDQVRTRRAEHFWSVQDVADVAARWSAGLPPKHVHVVTVPPSGAPDTVLVERFFSVLGVDPSRLDTTSPKANPSLGFPQAELLRRLNATFGDRVPNPRAGYNTVVKGWFAEQVLAAQRGPKLSLPPSDELWCEQVSRDVADRLAAAGYDVVGSLDELVPPAAAAGAALDPPGDSELLDAALEALATLLEERVEEVWEKKQRTRRRQRQSGQPAQDAPGAGQGEAGGEGRRGAGGRAARWPVVAAAVGRARRVIPRS